MKERSGYCKHPLTGAAKGFFVVALHIYPKQFFISSIQ